MAEREGGRDISVLHVDDDPQQGDVLARGIETQHDRIGVATESSPRAGLSALESGSFDCVVSDYDMPRTDGLEFLQAVRAEYPDLPFILFTGKGSEEIASEAISAGVTDYLQKGGGLDKYRVLANRIENAVSRYRAERDHERTERRYRTLAETVPDAILTVDPDGCIEFANPAVREVFGRPSEDLEGEDVMTIFPEDNREKRRAQFEEYVENRETDLNATDTEMTVRRPDGEEVPVSVAFGRTEFDGDLRITGVFRDITDRKRRERRVRQAERKFRKLVEQSVVGIYIIKDGEFEYINPYFADVMGYDQEEMLDGMSPLDLVLEEDEEKLKERVRKRIEGEVEDAHYTLQGIRKDGEEIVTEVHGSRIELDGEPAIIGAIRDITERERVREELEASEETFRSIAETSYDPIFRLDLGGQYTYLSPAVERVTGYEPAELEGESFEALVVEDDLDPVASAIETVAGGDPVEDVTFDIETKAGDRRTLSVNATPLFEGDAVVGIQGVARDVTDVERLAAERRAAEARFERILERIDDAFFALDSDWRFTHVNERAGELIDRDPDELVGEVVWDEFPAAVDSTFETEYRAAMDTQEPVQFEEYYPPLDAWFDVRVYPDRQGLSVFFRDVTERKRRERRLREDRDRIAALHEAAVTIAASETEAEVARRVVEAATTVLDHDLCSVGLRDGNRLVTEAISEGIPDDEYYRGTSLDATGNLAVETYGAGEARLVEDLRETPFAPGDGEYRATISVPIDDHGVFQAVAKRPGAFEEDDLDLAEVLAAHAATTLDRIRRERDLEDRETELTRQNERLEAFASTVSHDLRNPLAVAQGNIEIARRTGETDPLDEAGDALARMESMIDDVLALARGPGIVAETSTVSLATVAHEAWGNVSTTAAELADVEDRTLSADRGQLKRLLSNLFTNAVEHGTASSQPGADEAMEHGSTNAPSHTREDAVEHGSPSSQSKTEEGIEHATSDDDVEIWVGATDDGFYVADDGTGIDREDPTALFDPGTTEDAD